LTVTIDNIPTSKLYALKPLLSELAFDEPLIIENDLTDEEHALIADSVKRYRENPSSFVRLEDIK
jgi:hypothetical protein